MSDVTSIFLLIDLSRQIESLDLVNAPAPLAPELAMKEDLHGKEREKRLKADKVTECETLIHLTRSLDLPPHQ